MIHWSAVSRDIGNMYWLPGKDGRNAVRSEGNGVYLLENDEINLVVWHSNTDLPVLAGPFETLDAAKVAYLMLRAAG